MKKLISIMLMLVLVMGTVSGFAAEGTSLTQSVVFLDSATGIETAYIPEGGSVKAKVEFTAPYSGSAKVITAGYESSTVLSEAQILESITMTEGESVSFTTDDISAGDAGTVKLYVWGGESTVKPVLNTPAVIQKQNEAGAVSKFVSASDAPQAFTLNTPVKLGDIFAAAENAQSLIKSANICVFDTVGSDVEFTYTPDKSDWTQGTVVFNNLGNISLTVTDYSFCIPFTADITVEEPESVDKFVSKFTNTDYLYRVGNKNNVALGSLFGAIDGAQIGNVTVTVTPLDSSSDVSGTFNANADWTKATIDFNGIGPVEITIDDDNYANALSMRLEVIDATNATTAISATSGNVVLLNDTNGTFQVSGGNTFFGNGFSVNIGTDYRAAGTGTGIIGKINLNSGNLDNVKIVGPVYPVANIYQKDAQDKDNNVTDYFYNTVIVNDGSCKITNSYISGSRAALCVKSGAGDVLVENTTLSGGSFANLDIRGGNSVTLKDVTTVQTEKPNSYNVTDSSGNVKNMMGMGVVIDNVDVKLNIEGTLNQYNWVNQTQWNSLVPSDYLSVFPKLFTDAKFEANRHYRDGDTEPYVNTGIITICAWNDGANIIDNRTDKSLTYGKTSVTLGGVAGGVYTISNAGTLTDELYIAPEYASQANTAVAPKATFDYTTLNNEPSDGTSNVYCYYDATGGRYMISFDEGGSRVWDGKILTVVKGTETLGYTISVSGGLNVGTDNTITFENEGEYTVTYTYTDDTNYSLVNGKIEKYSATYTRTVDITVFEIAPQAVPAEFDFFSEGHRSEIINDAVYVMPDVSATVSSNTKGIGVTTIGGVNVYYPIVSMHKSGSTSWYNYFSVFEAVTITDSDQTTVYNTSTTAMPTNLEVIGGFILNASGSVSTAESASGTGIFNYSTGKAIKCATYSSYGLCYYPESQFTKTGTSSRAEQTIVAKYRYTDSNGKQYYYYIGYWCEEHTKTDIDICVTGDTMVTLSDGNQKRIDEVGSDDTIKVWNFYDGKYEYVPAAVLRNHGFGNNTVITLEFDDGTVTKAVNEHGYFDADLNKFVLIDESSANDYIGHRFIKEDGDGYTTVTLKKCSVKEEYIEAYSILTPVYYNFMADGILSITSSVGGIEYFTPFDISDSELKYDEEQMQKDVEKYGLYTYDEFAQLIPYETYLAINAALMKVAVGKNIISWDDLVRIIEIEVNGK